MPEQRRYLCRLCGHSAPWHKTENGRCAHEIQDENGTWMACLCPTLVAGMK